MARQHCHVVKPVCYAEKICVYVFVPPHRGFSLSLFCNHKTTASVCYTAKVADAWRCQGSQKHNKIRNIHSVYVQRRVRGKRYVEPVHARLRHASNGMWFPFVQSIAISEAFTGFCI